MAGVDGKMDEITKKMVIISNMDDTTQIMTKTITCIITGNTIEVKNMGNMAGMAEKMGNITGNMSENY